MLHPRVRICFLPIMYVQLYYELVSYITEENNKKKEGKDSADNYISSQLFLG